MKMATAKVIHQEGNEFANRCSSTVADLFRGFEVLKRQNSKRIMQS